MTRRWIDAACVLVALAGLAWLALIAAGVRIGWPA